MKKTIAMLLALSTVGAMNMSAMAANTTKFEVNGKPVTLESYTENKCVMVPVRSIAESLGFQVSWNADHTIKLNNGQMQSDLSIGENRYFVYTSIDGAVGMSAPFSLGAAPTIKNDRAYVPVELFVPLFGNDSSTVQISGDTVKITTPDVQDNASQIPNPLTEHASRQEIIKAVGFSVPEITAPDGYKASVFLDISGETADIRYTNGDKTLYFRMSRGSEDNSGDYNTYSTEKTVQVKNITVKTRGNDGIQLALWENGGFSYSISTDDSLTEAQVSALVSSTLQ